jgi:hypothetical protein
MHQSPLTVYHIQGRTTIVERKKKIAFYPRVAQSPSGHTTSEAMQKAKRTFIHPLIKKRQLQTDSEPS